MLLNGPTSILDDLYCSGKIDGYLFTPTEIKPRDTNPPLIKNSLGATAIEIHAAEVDIKQPLKINSISSNLNVSRSDPTGSGNVTCSLTNSGNQGFSSLYLQTTNQTGSSNETGQIFVGQNAGMVLHTRTNHPIQFKAYADQPLTTVPTSMKILSNTTRDV